jgi:hypothetical protein
MTYTATHPAVMSKEALADVLLDRYLPQHKMHPTAGAGRADADRMDEDSSAEDR